MGFPHRAARYRPRGSLFSTPCCWSCTCMEGILTRGWDLILPGCGGTLTLAQGATVAARRLYEPQPSNHQWMGVGFPYRTGWHRPRGSTFGSRVDGFAHVWRDLCPGDGILSSPGAERPPHGPDGQLPPRAGPMSSRQSATMGVGVPHRTGRYQPGGSLFSSSGCWCCRCMAGFLVRGWDSTLPWRRWLQGATTYQ